MAISEGETDRLGALLHKAQDMTAEGLDQEQPLEGDVVTTHQRRRDKVALCSRMNAGTDQVCPYRLRVTEIVGREG